MKLKPNRITVPFGLALLAATLLLGTGRTAFAQAGPMFSNPGGPVVGTAHLPPNALPPPPGVPEAAPNTSATTTNPPALAGLDPTAELFEAINKGDLASARDALGRGADLRARNVLGMTALEDAVDLNRNKIAFLLLSIEHEEGAAAGSALASPSISAPPAPAAMASNASAGTGSVEDILLATGRASQSGPTGSSAPHPRAAHP